MFHVFGHVFGFSMVVKVAHGKGAKGAEELIELLHSQFSSHHSGYLTTLDWSQAFDRMRPAVTIEALQQMNFAPKFIQLLHSAWIKQKRYLMFDGLISPHLLLSNQAMPQGDPLSPLVLAIWVTAGLRCTESEQKDQSPQAVQYAAYMDDRSFWCSTLKGLQERINSWSKWSQAMGLREKPN